LLAGTVGVTTGVEADAARSVSDAVACKAGAAVPSGDEVTCSVSLPINCVELPIVTCGVH